MGRADVGGSDGAMRQLIEQFEQSGLATTFERRLNSQVSADIAQLEGVGVQVPQRQGLGRPFGKDNEAGEDLRQEVEEGLAVYRLGPGFDGGKVENGC